MRFRGFCILLLSASIRLKAALPKLGRWDSVRHCPQRVSPLNALRALDEGVPTQVPGLEKQDSPSLAPSKNIQVNAAPVVVSWSDSDRQTHLLYESNSDPSRQVAFDVHCKPDSKDVFFKLRVPIELKGSPTTKTPLFLYVPPNRITSLSHDCPSDAPNDVCRKLGPTVTCLRFQLNGAPDMIVSQGSLVPRKQKVHGETLDRLKLLAQQTTFDVYLAHDVLGDADARIVCDAALDSNAGTIAGATDLTDHLTGLYAGKGGKILSFDSEPLPPAQSPPSYDELGPSPTPLRRGKDIDTTQTKYPKKRQRGNSQDLDYIMSACSKLFEDKLAQHMGEVRRELQQMKEEIIGHVEKRIEYLNAEDAYSKEEVDDRIDELREYNDDLIDVRLDDRILDIKMEAHDYVEEEIKEVEKRLTKRLKSANWVLEMDSD